MHAPHQAALELSILLWLLCYLSLPAWAQQAAEQGQLRLVLALCFSFVSRAALQTVCVDVSLSCGDLLPHGSLLAAIAARRRVNWTFAVYLESKKGITMIHLNILKLMLATYCCPRANRIEPVPAHRAPLFAHGPLPRTWFASPCTVASPVPERVSFALVWPV